MATDKMRDEQEQFQHGVAAMEAYNYPSALALLLPLAEDGHAEAQGLVGFLYSDGLYRLPEPYDEAGWDGLDREEMARWEAEDNPQAIRWLTRASEQGIGTATHNLAMFIYSHPGLLSKEEAEAEAKPVLRLAWRQGCRVFAFSGDDTRDYLRPEPEPPAV